MAQYGQIARITGPEGDAALERLSALDDAPVLQSELDAHYLLEKCRRDHEAHVRSNRTENVTSEALELAAAPAAGALATWRMAGGFPIGAVANWVLGGASKAASIYMGSKLPKFEDADQAPTPTYRIARILARSGKVFLHSQLSMMARDTIEDDK